MRPPRSTRTARQAGPPVASTHLTDLQLTGLGSTARGADPPVVIHNVVATANFGCDVDLEKIAWACHGEYNPRTFRAVKLRLDSNPKSTALIFSSGKMVCTGSNSECAALVAVNSYVHMVRRVHPEVRLKSATIQNIVASCALGRPVRLEALARALLLVSAFDPELFPGLRLKLRYPKTKVLVFTGGKCVIAGCKNRADVARAWAAVKKIVTPYLWNDDDGGGLPSHTALTATRAANRKNKI